MKKLLLILLMPLLALGADQNFTTYIDYDEGEDLTDTASTITASTVDTRTDTWYYIKDFTADYFGNTFKHQFTLNVSASQNLAYFYFGCLSEVDDGGVNDDIDDLVNNGDDLMTFRYYEDSGVINITFFLRESSTTYALATPIVISKSTDYFITVERATTQYTVSVRTVSHGGSHVSNSPQSVSDGALTSLFRYNWAVSSRDTASSTTASFTFADYDVDLPTTSVPIIMYNRRLH